METRQLDNPRSRDRSPEGENQTREGMDNLELAGSAYLSYKMGFPEEKRDLLKIVTSNRQVSAKNADLKLAIPFNEVANRFQISNSAPYWDIPRTWDRLIKKLVNFFKNNPGPEMMAQ
jgi:hypothetical protein